MKWGDRKRDGDPILAVWAEYSLWYGWWHLIEFAERKPHRPEWRDRYIPDSDGTVRGDVYKDESSARDAVAALNPVLFAAIEHRQLDPQIKQSLQLKASKALQAKQRLHNEETLMLQEGKRKHSADARPSAPELILPEKSEEYRDALAAQLFEMPYLQIAMFGKGHGCRGLRRREGNQWGEPFYLNKRGAVAAHRARIANAYGYSGTAHWGKTKAAIRVDLLPRANQLLKLASVQRLLDEALAKGEHVLVSGNIVFWYEPSGSVGWQVKTVLPSDENDGTAIWDAGEIVSKNHGRIVVLPYTKEDGEMVSGHTKNAPNDGPAMPRHPKHYVKVPFKRLESDLMIGLLGELPYE